MNITEIAYLLLRKKLQNGNTRRMSHLLDADAVVYAAPVYWYSIPAQIKGVIDRVFSFVIGNKDVSGKKCGIITCCEEHDPTVMEGATMPLHRTFDLLKWNLVGEVCVSGVFERGDIDKTDGCTQAAELAARF